MALMMTCSLELTVRSTARGDTILSSRILSNCFLRSWKLCVRVKLLNMNAKRNIWSLLLVFSIHANWISLVNTCWHLSFRNHGIWMNIIFLTITPAFSLYILFCFYLKYNTSHFIKDFENPLLPRKFFNRLSHKSDIVQKYSWWNVTAHRYSF